ncbi:MAG: nodulation protein NfeD [Dehalococcoidales bacterium]|jgi:membrane-bound serine protease (ClpP class)|nr:nodulation protein NfeD [Dehalococcoidales bacterium]MDD3265092.1 nodulation protein NfeD [Dehalococcoidales bacterium]MDD4323083.1 nodulation protein NfeD [Dehalococcoidales bacterium]MDD4794711.1 nodulation protein NfeD [Dehalococcoidales bacterium]MDX9803651.1 nodulation protein NfeD [Dehalococcoidales bacterium]
MKNSALKRILFLLLPVCVIAANIIPLPAMAAVEDDFMVTTLNLEGAITPVQYEYLSRGFEEAENTNSDLIVILMDTPGGLDNAMRDIIQLINNSQIPVAVYVIPGGRAASAGFYITITADIAAMAPNTAIGAATPVSLGSDGEVDVSDEMKAKLLNDSIAYARGLAEARGRNVEWAELAVREAASVPAGEALSLNVIDIVSPNLDSLLTAIKGKEITRPDGSTVVLPTGQVDTTHTEMNFIEGLLLALTDPNIAYILLSIAILGITVELFNPGLIFPGVIGAISGLMAFYSLGVLPVNYAGILLMVIAVGLFIAEAFTPTFGIFTAGGIISFAIGSLILFKGGPLFSVKPWLIVIILLIITALLVFIIQRVVAAHRAQASTGSEDLKGKTVKVRTALSPSGTVFLEGEIWKAVLDEGNAEPGETVTINRSEGLTLHVSKTNMGGN